MRVDKEQRLALLRRHWQYADTDQDITHEIYHDDAVLEFPQSGERFEGVGNFREWRWIYPAALSFEMRRVRGEGGPLGRRELDQVRRRSMAADRQHPGVPRATRWLTRRSTSLRHGRRPTGEPSGVQGRGRRGG